MLLCCHIGGPGNEGVRCASGNMFTPFLHDPLLDVAREPNFRAKSCLDVGPSQVQSLYTARQSRISPSSAVPCPRSHQSSPFLVPFHAVAVLGPRVPLGVPVWKPFLNFLATVLR